MACSFEANVAGQCATAESDTGAVEIEGSAVLPGSGGGNHDSDYDADGVAYIPVDDELDSVEEAWCDLQRIECVPWTPPAEDADGETGPITISDIASFRPQAPAAGMQPNQWMIVGLDTNFYATTSAHVVDGTLFGGTAQVRFTPIAYNWDYGDGSTATTSNPGKTWDKYRITEFDPTPASHVYEEPGNYTITLAVTYAAEYRVAGSSWQNVVGTLTIIAPPLTATAGHATTVLVDQDCIANPTGIGC
ncbi:PKD domain-containing protein [Salinibacterium sp. SWN167]|uniref:PKD domain-containing protein n=1 Tax=Salinibacterium sp. SWN167 TaxID=2792054 RepID=UPI001E5D73AD|nr:PKD domain-containing protein [Salinibacterium sp. SWN167]